MLVPRDEAESDRDASAHGDGEPFVSWSSCSIAVALSRESACRRTERLRPRSWRCQYVTKA